MNHPDQREAARQRRREMERHFRAIHRHHQSDVGAFLGMALTLIILNLLWIAAVVVVIALIVKLVIL